LSLLPEEVLGVHLSGDAPRAPGVRAMGRRHPPDGCLFLSDSPVLAARQAAGQAADLVSTRLAAAMAGNEPAAHQVALGGRRPRTRGPGGAGCGGPRPPRARLHVTSAAEAEESLARYPGLRVETIPNGVDVPETVAHARSTGALRLLYLGRLDPKKGIENLF